jgi:hypothetical protein
VSAFPLDDGKSHVKYRVLNVVLIYYHFPLLLQSYRRVVFNRYDRYIHTYTHGRREREREKEREIERGKRDRERERETERERE